MREGRREGRTGGRREKNGDTKCRNGKEGVKKIWDGKK